MYSDDVLVTNGTSLLPHRYSNNTKTGGMVMYIGLGGLLLLILILWLLGVI